MDVNDVFKKFVDTTLGMASTAAEKVVEFSDNMSKKGQEFKEGKKEEMDKIFGSLKQKFEESTQNLMKALHLKDSRVDKLEEDINALKKEIETLKSKIK